MSNLDTRIANLPASIYNLIAQVDALNIPVAQPILVRQDPDVLVPEETALLPEMEVLHADNG